MSRPRTRRLGYVLLKKNTHRPKPVRVNSGTANKLEDQFHRELQLP